MRIRDEIGDSTTVSARPGRGQLVRSLGVLRKAPQDSTEFQAELMASSTRGTPEKTAEEIEGKTDHGRHSGMRGFSPTTG